MSACLATLASGIGWPGLPCTGFLPTVFVGRGAAGFLSIFLTGPGLLRPGPTFDESFSLLWCSFFSSSFLLSLGLWLTGFLSSSPLLLFVSPTAVIGLALLLSRSAEKYPY